MSAATLEVPLSTIAALGDLLSIAASVGSVVTHVFASPRFVMLSVEHEACAALAFELGLTSRRVVSGGVESICGAWGDLTVTLTAQVTS